MATKPTKLPPVALTIRTPKDLPAIRDEIARQCAWIRGASASRHRPTQVILGAVQFRVLLIENELVFHQDGSLHFDDLEVRRATNMSGVIVV